MDAERGLIARILFKHEIQPVIDRKVLKDMFVDGEARGTLSFFFFFNPSSGFSPSFFGGGRIFFFLVYCIKKTPFFFILMEKKNHL